MSIGQPFLEDFRVLGFNNILNEWWIESTETGEMTVLYPQHAPPLMGEGDIIRIDGLADNGDWIVNAVVIVEPSS